MARRGDQAALAARPDLEKNPSKDRLVPWLWNDVWNMDGAEAPLSTGSHGQDLLDLYDQALPEVHGYLLRRCRGRLLAEDLTSETFLAAVTAAKAGKVDTVTVAWLIGIARHKLVDHWRREERDQRRLTAIAGDLQEETDGWEAVIDRRMSIEVLAALSPQHRAALTLRYVDGLPVAHVASHMGRTVQATEALLTRSKAAFRRTYTEQGGGSDD